MKIVSAFFILSFLLLTIGPLTSLEVANAFKVSAEWGHLALLEEGYDEAELTADDWVTSIISYDCTQLNGPNAYSPYIWGNGDFYWSDTTNDDVQDYLEFCNYSPNFVQWSVNWWVGDFKYIGQPNSPPYYHWGFASDAEPIYDQLIHYYSTDDGNVESKQYFNFYLDMR